MIRYWLTIVMFPCTAGWLMGADDSVASDGLRVLAKTTGCVQATRCGGAYAGIHFERDRCDFTSFAEYHVMRSAEELAARVGAAEDATVQKRAEAQLARFLNVEAIDWDKQMVVAILGKNLGAEGDFEVEFGSLRTEDGVLHVAWRLVDAKNIDKNIDKNVNKSFPRLAYGLALLDRFDGAVQFNPERQIIIAMAAPIHCPIHFNGKDRQLTIRSAEELAAFGRDSSKSGDAMVQKQAETELVQLLKVKGIDWNKQMVLAIDGGALRGNVGVEVEYGVEFVSLQVKDKTLTVVWRLQDQGKFCHVRPKVVVLVERFDTVEYKMAESK